MGEIEARILAREWIACPMADCKKTRKGWTPGEVHCSDCGDHPGAKCPACEAVIDLVHHELEHMLKAARPPHRAAPGVYCTKGHGDQVMCCVECKVMWSTCCGETHDCEATQAERALPVPEHRITQLGDKVTVSFAGSKGSARTRAEKAVHEEALAGWLGWE